jgi:hypothetical protein
MDVYFARSLLSSHSVSADVAGCSRVSDVLRMRLQRLRWKFPFGRCSSGCEFRLSDAASVSRSCGIVAALEMLVAGGCCSSGCEFRPLLRLVSRSDRRLSC